VRLFGVLARALIPDKDLRFPETVEDFVIQTFIPEICSTVPASFQAMAIVLPGPCKTFILAKLRHNLLGSKSFPGHLRSPFQFNTLISSGSEKAGQVNSGWHAI
jgi:hypothetical protein